MPRAAVIIPARMGSTRFPGKVLASLLGKPIIQHVYEGARRSKHADAVIVATDSEKVMNAVESFGGRAVLTRVDHASGTDRIAEAAASLEYDIIVNVQGDEPMIRAEVIDKAIALLADDPGADMGTVAIRMRPGSDVMDPNVVKVAIGSGGYALYFSRWPIPYHRDRWKQPSSASASDAEVYKHVGIYSYRREVLMMLAGLAPTKIEDTEKLEQLRALEHGVRIKVAITEHETIGVDTPEDLERVERCLSSSS